MQSKYPSVAFLSIIEQRIVSRHLKIKENFYCKKTPNGCPVPVEFCVDFLPRMKNVRKKDVSKRTKTHLNEIGLKASSHISENDPTLTCAY